MRRRSCAISSIGRSGSADLVRDARDQLTDGRQLLRLEQLRLRRLQPIERRLQVSIRLGELVAHQTEPPGRARFLGDVLGDLHDARASQPIVDRKGRDAQNLLVRPRELAPIGDLLCQRPSDGARWTAAATQPHVRTDRTANLFHGPAKQRCQRGVAAQ
jgi:hypothetical protein